MSKTGKNKCVICGETPAYYSKRTKKVLCKDHTIQVLMKVVFGIGTIIAIIFLTKII